MLTLDPENTNALSMLNVWLISASKVWLISSVIVAPENCYFVSRNALSAFLKSVKMAFVVTTLRVQTLLNDQQKI